MNHMFTVRILNLKFSPNVGDGVVAECLETLLKKHIPDADIGTVDLSARDSFGASGSVGGEKLSLMTRLKCLPKPVHDFTIFYGIRFAILAIIGNKKWSPLLKDSDTVVIGGGHLLSDVDYYFPIRIWTALSQIKQRTTVHLYAVGIAGGWSSRALRLCKSAFRRVDLQSVAARDVQSMTNWTAQFKVPAPSLARDPGILAIDVYNVQSNLKPTRHADIKGAKTALGVSDMGDLTAHANGGTVVGGSVAFYLSLCRELLKDGSAVTIFTNGAPDDVLYMDHIRSNVEKDPGLQGKVKFLPRVLTSTALVKWIATQDLLIAHRLHANIVAYSCGVPHIGLGWDPKLKSFFDSVGRGDFIISKDVADPRFIPNLAARTVREGIDADKHKKVLDETRATIANLAAIILNCKKAKVT